MMFIARRYGGPSSDNWNKAGTVHEIGPDLYARFGSESACGFLYSRFNPRFLIASSTRRKA